MKLSFTIFIPFYTLPAIYASFSCSTSLPVSGGITLGDFSHSYECEENKKFSFIYNCSRNSKNYIIYIAICNLGVLECVHSLMNTESFSNAVLYFIILTIITDIYDDYTYIYMYICSHVCKHIYSCLKFFCPSMFWTVYFI